MKKPSHLTESHKQDTSKLIFSMSHYLVSKAELIKRKECWYEEHDRRVLADRDYTDEILGVGGSIGAVPLDGDSEPI